MRSILLGAVLALGASLPASADELLIEHVRAARDATVSTPQRGAAMERVRAGLGEPQRVRDAVGDPPITRWVYDDVTVYFEHDRVIHAVLNR